MDGSARCVPWGAPSLASYRSLPRPRHDAGAISSSNDTWAETTIAHGRLMLTVLGGLAEFERELIRARTGGGRKRAKAKGVKMGENRSSPSTRSASRSSAATMASRRLRKLVGATTCQAGQFRGLYLKMIPLQKDESIVMYENFKLCPDLKPADLCLVVEQYKDGVFERRFHTHVRKSRLSKDAIINLLKTLVARFYGESGMGAEHIVNCYLNGRGKSPSAATDLQTITKYSEPGVIRFYCGSDTRAWADEVFEKSKFRTETSI